MAEIGIIGGTGFYRMPGLEDARELRVATPFGEPSDALLVGHLDGVEVAFLSRHGRRHRVPPSALNARANIWALKSIGVQRLLSVSAVGSLQEHIHPLDVVVPDQLVDRTRLRPTSFFDQPGLVVHVGLADPFCPVLSAGAAEAAEAAGGRVHRGGIYVCIEGPQFSTKAESRLFRSWGIDVIGMTALPEARLAREAELCYAVMAMSTDYDVWHEAEEAVTADLIIQNLSKNVDLSQRAVRAAVPRLVAAQRTCACARALETAIVTAPEAISPDARIRHDLLIARYLRERDRA
jgi:5'-methylthioadenosine phosphorylase